MPGGAPRTHDREQLLELFHAYINTTEIPIVSEFAYKNGLHRQFMYEMPEFADAIKQCVTKKEAVLESKALNGDVNVTMAIFSLKQIGWKDQVVNTHQGPNGGPVKIDSTMTADESAKGYLQLVGQSAS